MSKSPLSHDAFFKKSLSIPNVANEYLQLHLPENVKKLLDFSTLKMQQDTFVSKALKRQLSDVLFSCKTHQGGQSFIYLLCEHQSTPDHWMSLRIFKYIFAIAERYLKQNPKVKSIPLIYPIVLYNGSADHNTPKSLHLLFEHPEIAKAALYNDYHLVDLSDISDEEIKKTVWAGTMQFFMKHSSNQDFIAQILQMLHQLQQIYKSEVFGDFIESILWYNELKLDASNESELVQALEKITNNNIDAKNIMGSFAKKYINVGKQEGIEFGIELGRQEGVQLGLQEGIAEGRMAEKHKIATRMMKLGIAMSTIILTTGLPEEEILNLK